MELEFIRATKENNIGVLFTGDTVNAIAGDVIKISEIQKRLTYTTTNEEEFRPKGDFDNYSNIIDHGANDYGGYIEFTNETTTIPTELYDQSPNKNPVLTYVEIPRYIEQIGSNAFRNCNGIEGINISEFVNSIVGNPYNGCGGLNSIGVDRNNRTYDSRNNCNAVIETATDKIIIGCNSTVVPPSVKAIGDRAFMDIITTRREEPFSLPVSVTSIGSSAFEGCSGLHEIILSNNYSVIKNNTFRNSGLDEINFPEHLTTIEAYAFEHCHNLGRGIYIPNEVNSVAGTAFNYCTKLEEIEVSEKNEIYTSTDENERPCNAIMTKGEDESRNRTLVVGCKNTEIPKEITIIGNSAFRGHSGLDDSIDLNSVNAIEGYAFYDTGLVSIDIPRTTNSISSTAFNNCSNLRSIIVNIGNETYTSRSDKGKECNCIMTKDSRTRNETLVVGCKNTEIPEKVESREEEDILVTIGANAFRENIKENTIIGIPSNIETIGEYAFEGCTGLYAINGVSGRIGIETIGNGAFMNCTNLSEFYYKEGYNTLPRDLNNTMGTSVFSGCSSLTNMDMTDSTNLTDIPDGTFYNCRNLQKIYFNDTVTSIGNNAFSGCNSVVGANSSDKFIAPNIQTIGTNAFEGCGSITTMDLSGLTDGHFSQNTLKGCSGLQELYLNGLTSLNSAVGKFNHESVNYSYFSFNNPNLETIYLNGITNINNLDTDAFTFIDSTGAVIVPKPLTNLYLNGVTNTTGVSIDSNLVKKLNVQNLYLENLDTVPDRMLDGRYLPNGESDNLNKIYLSNPVNIGNYAFCNRQNLNSIGSSIVNGVVGDYAFANTAIGNINLAPNSTIGQHAFENCKSLETVVNLNTVNGISDYAFSNCTSFNGTDGVLELTNVRNIGQHAFEHCGLNGCVNISNVNKINRYAFYQCRGLTSVTIKMEPVSYSYNEIYEHTFNGCNSLESVTLEDVSKIAYCAFDNCIELDSVNFNSTNQVLIYIGDKTFRGCSSLTSITIPNTVTTFGGWLFQGCSNLQSVNIPSNNSVTTIRESTFEGCSSLTSITIPSNIKSIGVSAFKGCSSFTSITIPSNVNSIGNNAFYGCSSLHSILFAGNVTSIGNSAFKNCSNLQSFVIPSNVTSIGESTFEGCSRLQSIRIAGTNVTSIGKSVFKNCSKLTRIECLTPTPPELGTDVFLNVPANCAIYVPSGSVTTYKNAAGWSERREYIRAI